MILNAELCCRKFGNISLPAENFVQKLMRSTLHLLAKEVYDDKWRFSQHNDGALILAISPNVKKQIILKTPKGISPKVKVKTPKAKTPKVMVKIKLRFNAKCWNRKSRAVI